MPGSWICLSHEKMRYAFPVKNRLTLSVCCSSSNFLILKASRIISGCLVSGFREMCEIFFLLPVPHKNEAAMPMWAHLQCIDKWNVTILPWSCILTPPQWAALIILSSWCLQGKSPVGFVRIFTECALPQGESHQASH